MITFLAWPGPSLYPRSPNLQYQSSCRFKSSISLLNHTAIEGLYCTLQSICPSISHHLRHPTPTWLSSHSHSASPDPFFKLWITASTTTTILQDNGPVWDSETVTAWQPSDDGCLLTNSDPSFTQTSLSFTNRRTLRTEIWTTTRPLWFSKVLSCTVLDWPPPSTLKRSDEPLERVQYEISFIQPSSAPSNQTQNTL